MLDNNPRAIVMEPKNFGEMIAISKSNGLSTSFQNSVFNPKEALAQNFGSSANTIPSNQVSEINNNPIQFGGIPASQNNVDLEASSANLDISSNSSPLSNNMVIPNITQGSSIPSAQIITDTNTNTQFNNQGLNNISIPTSNISVVPDNSLGSNITSTQGMNESNNFVMPDTTFTSPYAVSSNKKNIFDKSVESLGITQDEINEPINNNTLENGSLNPLNSQISDQSNIINSNISSNSVDNDVVKIIIESNSELAESYSKIAKMLLEKNDKIKKICESKNEKGQLDNQVLTNTASTIFDSNTGGLNPQSLDQVPGFINKAA